MAQVSMAKQKMDTRQHLLRNPLSVWTRYTPTPASAGDARTNLPKISCVEWRLVGSGLASPILCLAYRMRLSAQRIQGLQYDSAKRVSILRAMTRMALT